MVVANSKTLQVKKVYDLTQLGGSAGEIRGWCRGVMPVDERFLWVGYTRVRPTKFRENLSWIKSAGTYEQIYRPSHLSLYDLDQARPMGLQRCERDIVVCGLRFAVRCGPAAYHGIRL